MRQHHHVIALALAGRTILPSETAALTEAKHLAEAVCEKILLCLPMSTNFIDFPPGQKKRSAASVCRLRAEGFHSPGGAASTRQPYLLGERLIGHLRQSIMTTAIHRTSVDRPTPKFSAISRCVCLKLF